MPYKAHIVVKFFNQELHSLHPLHKSRPSIIRFTAETYFAAERVNSVGGVACCADRGSFVSSLVSTCDFAELTVAGCNVSTGTGRCLSLVDLCLSSCKTVEDCLQSVSAMLAIST